MKPEPASRWLAVAVCFVLCTRSLLPGATFTVTNTDDDGDGSLRAALAAATSGDTIDATGVSGTITLTTGELFVNKSVHLVGPGPGGLAVNGNASSRVFHVTSSNATVVIAGLTITNGAVSGSFPGNVGGGVWNDRAALTLSNCVISGNNGGNGPGGGIYNDGLSGLATLWVIASTISGNSATNNGGGIHNAGDPGNAFVSIIASTVSSNKAIGAGTVGGGVFNAGNFGLAGLGVSASTFSGNSANQSGGGIHNTAASSGNGSLSINSSTFSGNSAAIGGGIFHNGVGGTATLTIGNTILKAGASGANIINNGGSVGTFGYNLSSDNGGGVLTNSTDRLNTDPLLGPLANNGGPALTHALLPGSPAIDKGKSFGATTDQRGQPRPFDFASITNAAGGDGSDIGAFELNPQARFISITALADRQIQLQGAGLSDFTYSLQANTNLAVTNWALIGNATANGSGIVSFTDTNAPGLPERFYRLRWP